MILKLENEGGLAVATLAGKKVEREFLLRDTIDNMAILVFGKRFDMLRGDAHLYVRFDKPKHPRAFFKVTYRELRSGWHVYEAKVSGRKRPLLFKFCRIDFDQYFSAPPKVVYVGREGRVV